MRSCICAAVCWTASCFFVSSSLAEKKPDLRVGAAAVNLKADARMVLAGMLEARYADTQEGELRAISVVCEKPGDSKIAIVTCDVLWIPRDIIDRALVEIEKKTGIAPGNILVNATHTHYAPSTSAAHDFGVSRRWCEELRRGIIRSVVEANKKLKGGDCRFYFHLGEEKTVGANSRLLLPDGNITWINPRRESAGKGKPTGPFDPQLPLLDFRGADGKSLAMIWNHSTHALGTLSRSVIRSPSFYGLATQELEKEMGGVVSFVSGASGSTHNIGGVPTAVCIKRLKSAVKDARSKARRRAVDRLASIKRPFKYRVRRFDDAREDAKIRKYCTKYTPNQTGYIRKVFEKMRKKLAAHQGKQRETWIQAMVVGDVAIVGVPAEYFTSLGVDIKKRSPYKYTYVAALANDWIGYLPDRKAHELGGYQTWMGLHSFAEIGTGERMANEVVAMLGTLAKKSKTARPHTP